MWRGTLTAPTGRRQESVRDHRELHGGALVFVEGACAGTAVDRNRLGGRPDQHQHRRRVDVAGGIDERGAQEGPGDRRVPATTRTVHPGRGSDTGEGDRDSNSRTESTTDDGGGQAGAHGDTAPEGSDGTRTKALTHRMGRDRHDAGHGCQAGAGSHDSRREAARMDAARKEWRGSTRTVASNPGKGRDGGTIFGRVQGAWPAPTLRRMHRGKAGCRQGRDDCPVHTGMCDRAILFWALAGFNVGPAHVTVRFAVLDGWAALRAVDTHGVSLRPSTCTGRWRWPSCVATRHACPRPTRRKATCPHVARC